MIGSQVRLFLGSFSLSSPDYEVSGMNPRPGFFFTRELKNSTSMERRMKKLYNNWLTITKLNKNGRRGQQKEN